MGNHRYNCLLKLIVLTPGHLLDMGDSIGKVGYINTAVLCFVVLIQYIGTKSLFAPLHWMIIKNFVTKVEELLTRKYVGSHQ